LLHQPAGQGIAFFNEVKSVRETMERFVMEATAVLQGSNQNEIRY
jgi:hypothetical protein